MVQSWSRNLLAHVLFLALCQKLRRSSVSHCTSSREAMQGMVGEKVWCRWLLWFAMISLQLFKDAVLTSVWTPIVNAPAGFAELRLNYMQNRGWTSGEFGGKFGHCLAKFSPSWTPLLNVFNTSYDSWNTTKETSSQKNVLSSMFR